MRARFVLALLLLPAALPHASGDHREAELRVVVGAAVGTAPPQDVRGVIMTECVLDGSADLCIDGWAWPYLSNILTIWVSSCPRDEWEVEHCRRTTGTLDVSLSATGSGSSGSQRHTYLFAGGVRSLPISEGDARFTGAGLFVMVDPRGLAGFAPSPLPEGIHVWISVREGN